MVMHQALADAGFDVVEAGDASTALAALESEPAVDVLVSDIGLPGGMNGRQLAEAVAHRRPSLPVLLATGYGRDGRSAAGAGAPGIAVIEKPFAPDELVRRVTALAAGGRG